MAVSEIVGSARQLGSAIRATRLSRGLTQRELAERCGRSQRFVSELERGKETAELGCTLSVLDALGLVLVVRTSDTGGAGREAVNRLVVTLEDRLAEDRPAKGLEYYLEELS